MKTCYNAGLQFLQTTLKASLYSPIISDSGNIASIEHNSKAEKKFKSRPLLFRNRKSQKTEAKLRNWITEVLLIKSLRNLKEFCLTVHFAFIMTFCFKNYITLTPSKKRQHQNTTPSKLRLSNNYQVTIHENEWLKRFLPNILIPFCKWTSARGCWGLTKAEKIHQHNKTLISVAITRPETSVKRTWRNPTKSTLYP